MTIGGTVFDLLVVGLAVLYWRFALRLGFIWAKSRLFGLFAAVLLVAQLAVPVGDIIADITPFGANGGHIIAALIVGSLALITVTKLVRWCGRQFVIWQTGKLPSEEREVHIDGITTPWGAPVGGLEGLIVGVLLLIIIALVPVNTLIVRSAYSSMIAKTVIKDERVPAWFVDTFPRSSQTLPKGSSGAVVGTNTRNLPMLDLNYEVVDEELERADLVNRIQQARRDMGEFPPPVNQDVAEVVQKHSLDMAKKQYLSTRNLGGSDIEERALSSLGAEVVNYDDNAGTFVVWAHNAAQAEQAALEDPKTRAIIADPTWTEVAVGSADAGWFNGKFFTVAFIALKNQSSDDVNSFEDEDDIPIDQSFSNEIVDV